MIENYLNKIIWGDCKTIMTSFPDRCIDLTITSPPYDNLRDYKGYSFDFEGIAKELYRITKEGGIVVWVVGDATIKGSETGTSFKQALYFKEIGFNLHDTMIYQKNGCRLPSPNRYLSNFEYMFVFSLGMPKTTNLIKDRENRFREQWCKKGTKREKDGTLSSRERFISRAYGVRFNIWKYNTGYGHSTKEECAFEHPAIFPDNLAKDHIISWSNKADVILDPMCGSGTTCKMAKILERKFIGIDCSEEYCKLAVKRTSQRNITDFINGENNG